MKKPISPLLIGSVVVVALVAIGFFFLKATAGPEPTATNLPDYSKMSDQDIASARKKSDEDAAAAMASRSR